MKLHLKTSCLGGYDIKEDLADDFVTIKMADLFHYLEASGWKWKYGSGNEKIFGAWGHRKRITVPIHF